MMRLPEMTNPACKDLPTDLFFPESYLSWDGNREAVKAICNRCPIVSQCLDYALKVKVDGIWAGTTPLERQELRRRMRITSIPMTASIGNVSVSTSVRAKAARERKAKENTHA